ncbi:hypothetical protein Nos7524_3191 [Nostoc sp. PCC 7524]|nr:hypothetical protein Nos7524_3191 [Nostoc sp. PCC 7524]
MKKSKRGRGNLIKVPDRAFILYTSGYSLRKLEKHFCISKDTIANHFKKTYGPNYKNIKNRNGILPIIQEYLKSNILNTRQKEVVRRWLDNPSTTQLISNSDRQHLDSKLYTKDYIDKLTKLECNHYEKDWRELLINN